MFDYLTCVITGATDYNLITSKWQYTIVKRHFKLPFKDFPIQINIIASRTYSQIFSVTKTSDGNYEGCFLIKGCFFLWPCRLHMHCNEHLLFSSNHNKQFHVKPGSVHNL